MKRPSQPVTAALAAHIRFLLQRNDRHQHQMAALLDINPGRITDVKKQTIHPGVPARRGPFPV